jgi:galactitol-specific phosphotransferase system IIB component
MQAFRKSMLIALVIAALLAACGPAQQTSAQIQAQVQTSVALTVQAQNQIGTFVAQTVEAQSGQALATETSTPTETPTSAVPTLTPVVIPSPTAFAVGPSSGGGGGGGGGSTTSKPQKYLCTIVGQVPNDGSRATILKVGDRLDVKWTFRNDGTITWAPSWLWAFYSSQIDTDVASNSGLTMSSVGFQSSLGTSVAPDHTVTLGVELTAPAFDGRNPIRIGTAWTIIGDGVKFCKADINVEIIRPGMTP